MLLTKAPITPLFKIFSWDIIIKNYLKPHNMQSLSCHMLIDKALSSDKPNGHWFEADWLHCKCDVLSSNRKVDGSRLTGSTQACHSCYGSKNTGDGIASARN